MGGIQNRQLGVKEGYYREERRGGETGQFSVGILAEEQTAAVPNASQGERVMVLNEVGEGGTG